MQKHQTIYGEIDSPDWPDDLIVRSLAAQGEWSYIEQILAARLVRQGDAIWDGGAFLGTFGLGVAQIAAAGGRMPSSLLAIEPGLDLGPCVETNLARNAPCPARLASFAIGPASGHLLEVSLDHADQNHGALAYAVAAGDTTQPTIESRALWELRNDHGDYDFLKLDIEGMEIDAIRGDFDYLKDRRPVIWAECNEAPSSVLLLEAMVALGYEPVYLAFPAFRRDNHGGNPDLPFEMAYEAVLLAASPDRLAGFDARVGAEVTIMRPVRSSWDLRQALWATPRWANPEWVAMSRPELIALMGRLSRGEDLGRFLNDRLDAG